MNERVDHTQVDNGGNQEESFADRGEFIGRHIGPDSVEIRSMLNALGMTSLNAMTNMVVPDAIRSKTDLNVEPPAPEHEVRERARALAGKNLIYQSMIGMGYYDCHTPAVIKRNLLENPGWYTAYTPYQPEVSQGRLEALLNYQQMIVDLTGMSLANASLLDEGTACAEAMSMIARLSKKKSTAFFVDSKCHPQTIAVVKTRAASAGIDITLGDAHADLDFNTSKDDYIGVLLSYPDSYGTVRDLRPVIEAAHANDSLVVVASDLLALALLESPGKLGADIVVGNSQRFGVPMGYGGPHAAFFATHERFRRAIPGRIIGVSVDSQGNPALRMALQTREQHIRREKANSNICTAQVLLAVIASMYAVYHGANGIRRIAKRTHHLAVRLYHGLAKSSYTVEHDQFFDTLCVATESATETIVSNARDAGINIRKIDDSRVGIAFDETSTHETVNSLLGVFGVSTEPDAKAPINESHQDPQTTPHIPANLARTDTYLEHPVFNSYRTETEMLRYLRRLQSRDIALDRSMIPLGSCTMKLNATTEMEPVTEPGFANIHPFAPTNQAEGYQILFNELEADLAEITGYDAVSLQPNAGSQGEYAGLLAIRNYHLANQQPERDICLFPSSAHGTNPASAVMAGMRVVVVNCDNEGNVDVNDLKLKITEHPDTIAALLVTYPSTHGVFEDAIVEICRLVHDTGGQVYLDGANLNAMVGICRPGDFGADVSHLNLHKTFCIPHGGGGPGMGPIGVKAHLTPFLPSHPNVAINGSQNGPGDIESVTISAAPWGSASILPISWAYIKLMGARGLKYATQIAILNANYIAERLKNHYPIVYTGVNNRVAHECIIDMSGFKETADVNVEDVAKRLVDYGYHAPTMSWPVADSMMIEPTESESKAELDRFCDAMISIRREILAIEQGDADKSDNLLKNAPHTAIQLAANTWTHGYTREAAFFPSDAVREDKYWPPVARVDNVYGDRNLVCTCPAIDDYR